MDEQEAAEVRLRAAVDQACKIREEEAREVGTYWRALRRQRIPWPLAALLVRDWHGWRAHSGYHVEEE